MHAAAVWWALRQKGIRALPAWAASFPGRATLSFEYGDSLTIRLRNSVITCDVAEVPVHWLRRLGKPMVKEYIASADHEMALNEWKSAFNSLRLIAKNSGRFCINPPHTYATYAEKPFHLYVAKQVGLKTPKTLISSEPSDVESFLNSVDRVVFKAMKPSVWKSRHNSIYEIYTSEISKSVLRYDNNIRLCPGIYQELINKKHDVRITIMGKSLFGLSVTSDDNGDIDVRRNISRRFHGDVNLEVCPLKIPKYIEVKILRFMEILDIIFCTFDFVLDMNNEWYFLEANEMGQFLWMETMCPEIPAIDAFSEFIISEDSDFIYDPQRSTNKLDILSIMKCKFYDDYYSNFPEAKYTEDLYVHEQEIG